MKHVVLILLMILPLHVFAQEDHMLVTLGGAIGGSTIVEDDFPNFNFNYTEAEMDAGDGIQSEFGYEIALNEKMALRFLIGVKRNTESIDDVEYKLISYPASALFLITSRRVTFGGGLTYHINPTYTARGDFSRNYNDTANFDDALGFNILLNIRLTRSDLFSLGIRYTDITYEGAQAPRNVFNDSKERAKSSYSANNVAIFGIFKF